MKVGIELTEGTVVIWLEAAVEAATEAAMLRRDDAVSAEVGETCDIR